MKRIFIVLALLVPLAGCAGGSVLTGGTSLTASIANPVTPALLYDVENGAKIAVAGLLTYRRLCIAGKADTNCRSNITRIQPFTRQLCTVYSNGRCQAGLLADLRAFVRNNDQVNAITVFNQARLILLHINELRNSTGA